MSEQYPDAIFPPVPEPIFLPELSPEQRFNLVKYKIQVRDLDRDELESLLIETMRQLQLKTNHVKHFILKEVCGE